MNCWWATTQVTLVARTRRNTILKEIYLEKEHRVDRRAISSCMPCIWKICGTSWEATFLWEDQGNPFFTNIVQSKYWRLSSIRGRHVASLYREKSFLQSLRIPYQGTNLCCPLISFRYAANPNLRVQSVRVGFEFGVSVRVRIRISLELSPIGLSHYRFFPVTSN